MVSARQISLLFFFLAMSVFLPVLNAQSTNDGSQITQGAQAIRQPDKEEPPDDYQNHVKYPQPYAYGGLGLSRGAGYGFAYAQVGVGFMINTQHARCHIRCTNGMKRSDSFAAPMPT